MYPGTLDPETKSAAERRLYESFQRGLDDHYTVLHGTRWLLKPGSGPAREGEADFILAHPDREVLVLEVKGGAIAYDASAGVWTSTDKGGTMHDLKRGPALQARESMHTLLDLLRHRGAPFPLRVGYAVAFPDVAQARALLAPDLPRDLVLTAASLADISGWVARAMLYWCGSDAPAPSEGGRAAVQRLVDLCGRSWHLRPALYRDIVDENQKQIELTREQFRLLDTLSRHSRALILGAAGTGKTLMATEKAVRLARQGLDVLFLCYGSHIGGNLQYHLRTTLQELPNLHVHYAQELCETLAAAAGLPKPAGERGRRPSAGALLQTLDQAVTKLGPQYDALIVDEAQDFDQDWWVYLQCLLRDPDHGILYIFYDDHQRLFAGESAFPIAGPAHLLTVNCRSTRLIHEQTRQFYRGESAPTEHGLTGRPVEVVLFDKGRRHARLMEILHRLVRDEAVPPNEIVVLTSLQPEAAGLHLGKPGNGLHLSRSRAHAADRIFTTTIADYKGMERAVIVLAGIDHWPEEGAPELIQQLYAGCSRARSHLIVLLPSYTRADLRAFFAAPEGVGAGTG